MIESKHHDSRFASAVPPMFLGSIVVYLVADSHVIASTWFGHFVATEGLQLPDDSHGDWKMYEVLDGHL